MLQQPQGRVDTQGRQKRKKRGGLGEGRQQTTEEVRYPNEKPKSGGANITQTSAHSSDDTRTLDDGIRNNARLENFNTTSEEHEAKARKCAKRQLQKQTKQRNERNTPSQDGSSGEKKNLEVLRKRDWESAMATEAEDRPARTKVMSF